MANVVKTGEVPGKGKYHCTNCDQMIELSSGDTMPPCLDVQILSLQNKSKMACDACLFLK